MDTIRKLKKAIQKMNDQQLEAALTETMSQKHEYIEYAKGQEQIHKALIKNRMMFVKKGDKDGEDTVSHQIEIVEKELERLRKIDREFSDQISIIQKAIREREEGSIVKSKNRAGWLAVGSTAVLSGLGLFLGYKSDNSGTMKNKSPIAMADKCIGWLKGMFK